MMDFSIVSLDQLVVHKIGNKLNEEPLQISKKTLELKDEGVSNVLIQYFLKPFKSEVFYQFEAVPDLENNLLYSLSDAIFKNNELFHENSVHIANHLYETTNHPNIKEGELYVAYIQDCKLGDEYFDAIGLFKSENKETFLRVFLKEEDEFDLTCENGVNINKLDKGCLIINTKRDEGYKILMVDNTARSEGVAQFWQEDFLQAKMHEDKYFHTQNYMNLCKGFADEVFNPANDIDRTEQMKLMKNSVDYFSNHKEFDQHDFESQVMGDPGVIEAFNNYKQEYAEKNDIPFMADFDVSSDAVKSNKRFFKSVLKLDKKFHVYVHGGHNYIERGFDDNRKMNFYKLYFDEEF